MIEIKDLSFAYKRKDALFTNLNLTLKAGNIYGLLGKNGAGKTTLLKLISGLLFPHSGECRTLDYYPPDRVPEMLGDIYFIPEEFYIPPVSIKSYQDIYSVFYPRFDNNLFLQFLEEFALTGNDILTTLSYGQKKKFLFAFGLASCCRLLILDEPTNGLDIPAKSQFRKMLANFITEEQSFIISTHQVRDLENLIDPIIILDEGEIIFQHHIHEISESLSAELLENEPEGDDIIYLEKVLGGYTVLKPNTTGSEQNIDIELLFNAVINNKEKIAKVMNREKDQ